MSQYDPLENFYSLICLNEPDNYSLGSVDTMETEQVISEFMQMRHCQRLMKCSIGVLATHRLQMALKGAQGVLVALTARPKLYECIESTNVDFAKLIMMSTQHENE